MGMATAGLGAGTLASQETNVVRTDGDQCTGDEAGEVAGAR